MTISEAIDCPATVSSARCVDGGTSVGLKAVAAAVRPSSLTNLSERGWLPRSGSSAGPEHLHDSGGRREDAGGPDDWCERREDLVNSLHANSGLAGGTEVHQVRVGRRVERHEGGQPDEHQRIVIKA